MSSYLFYCRKSSESEERQILSIDTQIAELNNMARSLRLRDFDVLTEARSAKYPGRPVFNAMMEKIYRGEVKALLCWKLDRLARNPIDGAALIWALDRGNLEQIITPHGTFQNNSNDKFLMQLEFGMAKKYVDDLSDNVKRGNKTKLEKGWLPGLPPLGYLNEPAERTIVKDPERFPLVRKMWDLLLEGVRPSAILKTANDEWSFRTRTLNNTGGKPLALGMVYKIFANPFYYGLIERKEGVFIGRHESMITEDEFWKAQEILGRKGRPRPKNHQFAYTGLIRCGACGLMVTAEEKYNKYGSHYVYYRCTKKKRDVVCKEQYVNVGNLESQILTYLKKIQITPLFLSIVLAHLDKEGQQEEELYLKLRRSLEKALKDCERKLENLNHMRLNDLINDNEYSKEKKSLVEEKIRLQKRLGNESGYQKRARDLTKQTFLLAHNAVEEFQSGSLEKKRYILESVGSNFFLKEKKLIIEAEKPIVILEEGLAGFHEEHDPLESQKNGCTKREMKYSAPSTLLRWTRREDVRTFSKKTRNTRTAKQLKKMVRAIYQFYQSSLMGQDLPKAS